MYFGISLYCLLKQQEQNRIEQNWIIYYYYYHYFFLFFLFFYVFFIFIISIIIIIRKVRQSQLTTSLAYGYHYINNDLF